MSARERWIFRLLLSVLIGWEVVGTGYMLSQFPYHAVDFFQHDFLARFLQQGGQFTDPSWPMQIGSALGLRLPPGLERTAPLLLYQPIVLPLFRVLALFPMHVAYAIWLAISLMLIGWTGWRITRALGTPPLPVLFALGLWPAMWRVLLLGDSGCSFKRLRRFERTMDQERKHEGRHGVLQSDSRLAPPSGRRAGGMGAPPAAAACSHHSYGTGGPGRHWIRASALGYRNSEWR